MYKVEAYKQIKITQADFTTKDPVDQFVYLEMNALKAILEKVNETIVAIIGVLKGTTMLTPIINNIATELLKGVLPQTWEKLWDGPEIPS